MNYFIQTPCKVETGRICNNKKTGVLLQQHIKIPSTTPCLKQKKLQTNTKKKVQHVAMLQNVLNLATRKTAASWPRKQLPS